MCTSLGSEDWLRINKTCMNYYKFQSHKSQNLLLGLRNCQYEIFIAFRQQVRLDAAGDLNPRLTVIRQGAAAA